MREVIMTGATVEEATTLALQELGLSEDEVTVEIIDLPQRKLFKKIPAKVRVSADEFGVNVEDVFTKEEKKPAPKAAPRAAVREDKPAPKAAPRAAVREDKPAPKAEPTPAPKKEKAPREDAYTQVPVALEDYPKAQEAVVYLKDIIAKMGVGAVEISAVKVGETLVLKVDGEEAGALIGHRGEVMESLSYLTSLVANRTGGDYIKIGLDINNYRAKREGNLEALAKRIGTKVAKTGRSQTLEPMNPYERRIIHSAISEIENVKSESVGEGVNRRVVVRCTGENAQANRPLRANTNTRGGNNKGGRGNNRGGKRPQGDRAPRKSNVPERTFADKPKTDAAPVVSKRTETINDGANVPLYGKVEF